MENNNNLKPVTKKGNDPDSVSKKPPNDGSEFSHSVDLEDLETYVAVAGPGELKKQYEAIPIGEYYPCKVAKKSQNSSKNRYEDLLPYDQNRVVLRRLEDDPHSDYINASYIDGFRKKKAYICAQGPLDVTVDDFWRMVWQEGVQTIIMAVNIIENGIKKCEKYWPDKKKKYGKITVILRSERTFLDYTIRNFIVMKSGASKPLTQYHFTAWPDHGVPPNVSSLDAMLRKAHDKRPSSRQAPILLHCSAGVGRTGTILLYYLNSQRAQVEGTVDIPGTLHHLRKQRMNLVETPEQYLFVYQSLVECQFHNPSKLGNELVLYLNVLRRKDPSSGISPLELQFNKLRKLCPPLKQEECSTATRPENLDRNRKPNILPPDAGLVQFDPSAGVPYINAIYVPGYGHPEQFIVTQYPLPHTLLDFWRMTLRSGATDVVMLNHLSHNDKNAPVFWSDDGCKYFGDIRVEHLRTKEFSGFLVRKQKIKDLSSKESRSKVLRLFHYYGWSKDDVAPPSLDSFVLFLEKICRRLSLRTPTVVMCYDGCSMSGYFCAAAHLYLQDKEEGRMDVFQSVRTVRLHRPAFILNKNQYRWLYEAACRLATLFAKAKK